MCIRDRFDTLQRLIYMLTFSMVDIDRDEDGQPKPHFLIKRAVGMPGDRVRFIEGELELRPPGFSSWIAEKEFLEMAGLKDRTKRLIAAEEYPWIRSSAYADAYRSTGFTPPKVLAEQGEKMRSVTDMFEWMKYRNKMLYQLSPQDRRLGGLWRKFETGWYISDDLIFPLGDNRDNSRDARYFGPVELDKVLGRAMFVYWPLDRIGSIE